MYIFILLTPAKKVPYSTWSKRQPSNKVFSLFRRYYIDTDVDFQVILLNIP